MDRSDRRGNMQQEPNENKHEECISIKGCKIILRYSDAPKKQVLDNMGKILCGQKYAPEICKKS